MFKKKLLFLKLICINKYVENLIRKNVMLLPSNLSTKPEIMHIHNSEYSFIDQKREFENAPLFAGMFTANSVQTYDWQGQPNDARSDSND